MPEPRWPTTAARSCCSTRPGIAEVGGVKLESAGARRADRRRSGRGRVEGDAGAAVPRPRRRPPRAAPGGRRPDRGSPGSSAIKQAAGQLRVQLGEAILPLPGATGAELGDGKVRLFRLNDGAHEIGYAFAEVIDFATIEHDVIHAERPGEISGVSLIDGEPAELVDAHWLFANHVGAAARADRAAGLPPARATIRGCRTCCARSSRPPAIASSATTTNDDADLVIAVSGEELPEAGAARRSGCAPSPKPASKKDDSIYRYDRAGPADGARSRPARGGANERAAAGRDHRRRARRAARRRGRIGGRAGHADPGAARRAACRRPVGAAQPGADGDRLHALARARRRPIAPTASARPRSSSSTAIITR